MRCLFVLILYISFRFPPLGREAHRSATFLFLFSRDADSRKGILCPFCVPIHKKKGGVSSLKNVDFSDTYPLNSMSHLRGCVTVLEIDFVGLCEVFVCLDFVHFFSFFSLGRKAHRSTNGVSILLKMSIFPTPTLLKMAGLLQNYPRNCITSEFL